MGGEYRPSSVFPEDPAGTSQPVFGGLNWRERGLVCLEHAQDIQ